MTFLLLILAALAAPARDLRQDAAGLWHRDHAGIAAGGGTLALIAYAVDDAPRDDLGVLGQAAGLTDIYGASSFNLPVSLGLWGLGRATGRPGLRRLGYGLTRTLTLTQAVVGPLKLASHRRRPERSNYRSFPSGHTANAFAVARYLHRRYGPRAGVPLYAAAVATGAGRIEGRHHYLSDVIVGATVGLVIGNAVGRGPATDEGLSLFPAVPGARGLTVAYHVW